MTRIFPLLAAALIALPAYAAPSGFVDPLDQPARASVLASRALINGVARAGPRLVAVGQRGHVLYSDNDGAAWLQAAVPLSSDLAAVTFTDARHGWAVGHDAVVLHSADGGASWRRADTGTQTGLTAGATLADGSLLLVSQAGQLLRSRDGGASFKAQAGVKPGPAAAAMPLGRASLLVGGPRGLRVQPLEQ